MKLQFDKSGRRFFFLTFALRGRPQALSRIVEKPGRNGRPGWAMALLPPGEAVAELWRGVHGQWPFLTASNFCIMPDHVLGEKELERRLRTEPFTRWIKTVAHGLPPRFDPTVEDSRFLAEGRQLFLSSFPDEVPVFPVNYDNCHLMNARNEALCARAAAGSAGSAEAAP